MPVCAIHWFRRDLRTADNPALADALSLAERVAPLFIEPDPTMSHGPGAASLAWLEGSLAALDTDLHARGSTLARRIGPAPKALARAASECGAIVVTCTRDWTPAGLAEEQAVATVLAEAGVELHVAESQLLAPPGSLIAASGSAYAVFTPFSRAWRTALRPVATLLAPDHIPTAVLGSQSADAPAGAAAYDVTFAWTPGEAGARRLLGEFVRDGLEGYATGRDLPGVRGTSELSPHLAWGEISPRQVVEAVSAATDDATAWPFLRQLAWREFACHVLVAHPSSLDGPLRSEFAAFPWREDAAGLEAWLEGRTGYPLVDAGMRQLAETGWMHNRVRLVAASLLVKDLLVPWQTGEEAFRNRLVDYDPAANAFNWQWVAGSGADAAPYFRIFNPSLQGTRFDADGTYVRRWVPELARLSPRWVQQPWLASEAELRAAGVTLGRTYPRPVVDHAEARVRALAALRSIKGRRDATSQ